MALVSVIVFFVYALVMVLHGAGYIRLRSTSFHPPPPSFLQFSIIICARNEAPHIKACLGSILQQVYPKDKLELIVVNDASTDLTAQLAEQVLKPSGMAYKILTNPLQKGKKQSLALGIEAANNPFIITRDADTISSSVHWLASINKHQQQLQSDFIIGPVTIRSNFGMLWALQAIEQLVLQVFSGGAAYFKRAYLCSGANLIFRKSVYEAVNGYQSHWSVASGDDVLFLEDVKASQLANISYLKDKSANVETAALVSFRALFQQKVRWAAKFNINPNPLNTFVAFGIFITNLLWLVNLTLGFFNPLYSSFGLIFTVFKLLIDILLLFLASDFIKDKRLWLVVLPVGMVYPLYAVIVAIGAVFVKSPWKSS